jgi:ankyrin repeat protein
MSRDINRRRVDSTGDVFNEHGVDPDWKTKARKVSNAAVSHEPDMLRDLEYDGLIRGYTEYRPYGASGCTPLIRCILSFRNRGQRLDLLEMVRILLDNGANPFTQNNQDGGVLCVAAAIGDIDLIELILSSAFGNINTVNAWQPDGFDKTDFVNMKNQFFQTPLHIAIGNFREGHSEIIDFLIENGADVNAVDCFDQTPLFLCKSHIYSGIIDILIDNGADVNAVDEDGETPLYHHVLCLPVIQQLVHHDADVNIKNRWDDTPLHAAKNHPLNIKFLIYHGADIEASDDEGHTPINRAVKCQNIESVQELFLADANLFTVDEDGNTLLHLAFRSEPITRFLIEQKADVNAVNNEGRTPLMIAVVRGTLPSAMLLWRNGADLYLKDNDGVSAYEMCIRSIDNPVNAVVEAEICHRRNEAFAMVSHKRLGGDSKGSGIDEELIRMILEEENKSCVTTHEHT